MEAATDEKPDYEGWYVSNRSGRRFYFYNHSDTHVKYERINGFGRRSWQQVPIDRLCKNYTKVNDAPQPPSGAGDRSGDGVGGQHSRMAQRVIGGESYRPASEARSSAYLNKPSN